MYLGSMHICAFWDVGLDYRMCVLCLTTFMVVGMHIALVVCSFSLKRYFLY